jgi:crotonobetainyl-CoA:carnitine CoA-transferase CaiB-like acyl-CoA transferase
MLVEVPSGTARPVLSAGNPIKMSALTEGPVRLYPQPGQHTDEVLTDLLGMRADDITARRTRGAFG